MGQSQGGGGMPLMSVERAAESKSRHASGEASYFFKVIKGLRESVRRVIGKPFSALSIRLLVKHVVQNNTINSRATFIFPRRVIQEQRRVSTVSRLLTLPKHLPNINVKIRQVAGGDATFLDKTPWEWTLYTDSLHASLSFACYLRTYENTEYIRMSIRMMSWS